MHVCDVRYENEGMVTQNLVFGMLKLRKAEIAEFTYILLSLRCQGTSRNFVGGIRLELRAAQSD